MSTSSPTDTKNATDAFDIERQASVSAAAAAVPVAPRTLGAGVSQTSTFTSNSRLMLLECAVSTSSGRIRHNFDYPIPQSDGMARRDNHQRLRGQLLLHRRIWTRHHRTMGALSGKWFRLHSIQRIRYTSLMHPVSFFPE